MLQGNFEIKHVSGSPIMAEEEAAAQEHRRLHAVARRAAKDSLVSIDIKKQFSDVMNSGLDAELNAAFTFTQTSLAGFLECILCCAQNDKFLI